MPAASRWVRSLAACVLACAAVVLAAWAVDDRGMNATVAAEWADREAAQPDSDVQVQWPDDLLADPWRLPEGCITEDNSSLSLASGGRNPHSSSTGRVGSGDSRPPRGLRLVGSASRANPRRSLRILLCKWVV
ncbi:MAG TPA: hypothetical protein DD670_03030 [Planctomycetaceae bacterium]|nr:hypothetical protein [Planctomycetaceae bacterium]